MGHTSIATRIISMIARLLREIVAAIIRWSGIPPVIRRTICRRRATIIVYHDPSPQILERHLRYLAKRYEFVSLSSLVDALRENRWGEIPSQALVVTLDDGHKNNFLLPDVFEKYAVSPTVFVCSHLVGTFRHFWWSDAESVVSAVKKLPKNDAQIVLERATGYSPEKEYGTRAALNEGELRGLQSCAEIGSHTCFHPVLVNCENEDCWKEISSSKTRLERVVKGRVAHFSYPNGDYTRREATMAADAGYLSARTLDVGWVNGKSDPYRLKAVCIQDDGSTNVLSSQVLGVFQYLHSLLRGKWNGRRPRGIS